LIVESTGVTSFEFKQELLAESDCWRDLLEKSVPQSLGKKMHVAIKSMASNNRVTSIISISRYYLERNNFVVCLND
jgi:hypothetical protein